MKDFECTTAMEKLTYLIEFEIRKHGSCRGNYTVEDAVNGLSQFELLQLVTDYLDSKETQT